MGYAIQAIPTPNLEETFWYLQQILRQGTYGSWAYVDGRLDSTDGKIESDWNGAVPAPGGIDDGDYIVFQLPVDGIGADDGIVQLKYVHNGTVQLELHAHTGGWHMGTHAPNLDSVDLGSGISADCIVCGNDDVSELRVIVNEYRAIIFGMDALLTPSYVGYLGFIQTHYTTTGAPGGCDPNPLLCTGGQNVPGAVASTAPMRMLRVDGTKGTYTTNRVTGLLDTDGDDMLATMQWNRRSLPPTYPPVPTRTLIPCVVGCDDALNTEIRGELYGVFFYGPAASLAEDTPVSRSDGTYVVIDDIVVGPVGA